MRRLTRQIVVHSLLLVYLVDGVVGSNSTGVGDLKTRCRDGERQALLKFKDNLDDDHDVLPSWNNKEENRECCNWCGIRCDNVSGHVIMLDLCQSTYLRGNISSSLIELSHLNYLNLQGINLSGNPIPTFFVKMTSLTYLNLSWCNLQGLIPESVGNLIALDYLDLSHNKLEGEIPKSIWNICTLKILNVSSNKLSGQFSEPNERSCGQYSLEHLDVSRNSIMGSFPNLTLFPSLKTLSLSSNQLNGSVHQRIGQLSELEYLDISNNSLEGVISEAHFAKLSKLRFLDLSFNQLHLNVSSAWIPPFKLEEIRLSSCKLGPQFPEWLQTQNNYIHLDISNTKISDPIPSWFWNLATNSTFLNVSNNQIRGAIANSTVEWNYYKEEIDLSSNQLEGPVPLFLFKVNVLQLSRNNFSDINSACGVTEDGWLTILDLSYNQLSGKLFNCWSHFNYLKVLNLAYNELVGEIPKTIGSLTLLEALLLSKNRFVGELPLSLKNCTELKFLMSGKISYGDQYPLG
ncbi:hypothetical protein FNV43_RR19677 [Rhamnella rubrinervis]|uniref:Uncharacterized protein n=1 Tax=Rhamnella rubrinervis TaxID=2594499 RepID=A0A8K0DZP6_9ROSA|nr:hypothetical protein FNV43_RR19677 [Rhamnella rubrinervis]